jgi:phage terminase large subunit GpA-like protein
LAHALAALIPPIRSQLGAWIERKLVLPEVTSALPVRVRLWPYQCEIANVSGEAEIERMTLVKDVRLGCGLIATACKRARHPTPRTCGLPFERGVWWFWPRKHH